MIHIHQGGTTRTYCGQPLRLDDEHTNVSWEQADLCNCDDCLGSFISAPAPRRSGCRDHGIVRCPHCR